MTQHGVTLIVDAEFQAPDIDQNNTVMDVVRASKILKDVLGEYHYKNLDENPALGPQGLYYYFHTMSKALTLYGADTLETPGGQKVKWREQLALKLINLQRADGSWVNENGRWFEKDPNLVTAYSLIALDMLYNGL